MFQHLSPTEINCLKSTLRQHLSAEATHAYKGLSTDQERRSYLAQFVLDPAVARTNGFNKSTAFDVRADDATSGWVTLEELGGPRFLASMTNADILISSGSLVTEHEVRRTGELVSPASTSVNQMQTFFGPRRAGCRDTTKTARWWMRCWGLAQANLGIQASIGMGDQLNLSLHQSHCSGCTSVQEHRLKGRVWQVRRSGVEDRREHWGAGSRCLGSYGSHVLRRHTSKETERQTNGKNDKTEPVRES